MSENDKGFGPKKPKATFGDVMLGIPAGRGGEERGDKGKGKPRRDDRPKRDAPPPEAASHEAHTEGTEPTPAKPVAFKIRGHKGGDKQGGGQAAAAPAPKGPLVVVKRASGVVETRGPLEDSPSSTISTDPVPGTATEEPRHESARVPAPTPTKSALFEEMPEDQSFAEMFEASAKNEGARKHFRPGEKVSGTIFQLGADTAFITLGGGKSEAMIELRELKDSEGILRSGVGDKVDAYVVEAGARGIILSKALGKGGATLSMLSDARASGMPVDGLVLSVNKGGFEVAVGDIRAFCPVSQMDLRFVEKPELFVGERLKFRVTEVRERNVVLSRRALLEEEQKTLAVETRKNLFVGAVLKGSITGVRDFGAFVDLGGVEGLIPVSELTHGRVGHPSEVVNVRDEVEVEVIRMEPGNPNSADKSKQKERITLSMRSRQEDPFNAIVAELHEGDKITGKVSRLQPFGAFVEVRPGVDGLIHISAMSDRRIAHPRDVLKEGQEVTAIIEKIDAGEKRIGLRLWDEASQKAVGQAGMGGGEHVGGAGGAGGAGAPREQAPKPRAGQVITGKVDRIEPYGIFLAFAGGKGLVPASETGTERGTDMRRAYTLGQELKASILDIDASGKIRLSLTAAERAAEREEMEAWKKSQPKGTGGKGFGTLADLLKGMKTTK